MRPSTALAVSLLFLASAAPTLADSGPPTVPPEVAELGPEPVSVIVSFHEPPGLALLEEFAGIGTIVYVYSVIDAVQLILPGDRIPELARVEGVTRIDPDEALAWHLDTSRPAVHVGPDLWDQGLSGEGVTIAVVDTGIDALHPSVQGRVVQGVIFPSSSASPVETPQPVDTDGHGTHVAAITAGSGASSTLVPTGGDRYAGLAIGADLVSLDISLSFTTATAIKAFDWVHQNFESYNIVVVQNSWGRQEVGQPFDPGDPAVRASDALVRDDGLVVVFSAGNEGPGASTLSMEAQNPNVLTVGAVDDAGVIAEFSSRGPAVPDSGALATWTKPDVAAPGVRIMSAAAGVPSGAGLYRELSGTSQAAPHAAGIVALVRSVSPELGALEVMELLRRSARDLGPPGPDTDTGSGLVDAAAALRLALASPSGELLVPVPEEYTETGVLVLGPAAVATPATLGAAVGSVAGTVPVKERAESLGFTLEWAPVLAVAPVPGLRVTLTPPSGAPLDVPARDAKAQIVVANPAPGLWAWEARPTNAASAGTVEYVMETVVVVPSPLTLAADVGGGGGFFDDSRLGQFDRVVSDLEAEYGPIARYAVWAAVGILAVLLLTGLGKLVRRK